MTIFKVQMIIATTLIFTACGSGDQLTDRSDAEANLTQNTSTDSLVIDLVGIDSLTVLDLLKTEHQVDYRPSLVGAFVTSIDSVENSSDCFWVYSINDTMAQVACDRYVTSNGDRVKWHFRRMGE